MERFNLFLLIASCLVCSGYAFQGNHTKELRSQEKAKKWCTIIAAGSRGIPIREFTLGACTQIDCGPIKPTGACYEPDNDDNHGNWSLNMLYKTTGLCYPELGTITTSDPSYGNCKFP